MNIFSNIRPTNKIFLLFGVILLFFIVSYVFPVGQFLYLQAKITPWTDRNTDSSQAHTLEPTKNAACFLISKSNSEQRRIIESYDRYVHQIDPSVSKKLYILLRILFDVPDDHPIEDAAVFAAYLGEGSPYPYDPDVKTVNLLWPLTYQEGELAFREIIIIQYIGPPYCGICEYDYFFTRFPFRTEDELGCN